MNLAVRSTDLAALLNGNQLRRRTERVRHCGDPGLLARFGVVSVPMTLHLLTSWYVIGASLALFLLEFFVDKIPAFDLIWNALHTFVRVPVATLLAWGATAQLSPTLQIVAAVAGGGIALAAHSGKIAARAAVSSSPEPFSNTVLSLGEDVLSVFLTWFVTQQPYLSAAGSDRFAGYYSDGPFRSARRALPVSRC